MQHYVDESILDADIRCYTRLLIWEGRVERGNVCG